MKGEKDMMVADIRIKGDEDVIAARQKVRQLAQEVGLSLLDQTRLVTAVSELARNISVHAGEGSARIYRSRTDDREGVKVVFEDNGPGIPDIEKALEEGFSTTGSLGLGLKGAKRLVDEFEIRSKPGEGTMVQITKWKE